MLILSNAERIRVMGIHLIRLSQKTRSRSKRLVGGVYRERMDGVKEMKKIIIMCC